MVSDSHEIILSSDNVPLSVLHGFNIEIDNDVLS